MHVSFKIHYRNNLIDKKDSYLIPRPPSWDDRNYSNGHQLYPSDNVAETVWCLKNKSIVMIWKSKLISTGMLLKIDLIAVCITKILIPSKSWHYSSSIYFQYNKKIPLPPTVLYHVKEVFDIN